MHDFDRIHDATDSLLATAREYGHGDSRDGDVVAAAYRLAAAKLREHAAKDLERVADQADARTP